MTRGEERRYSRRIGARDVVHYAGGKWRLVAVHESPVRTWLYIERFAGAYGQWVPAEATDYARKVA